MKSLEECNALKKPGDVELIAKACGASVSNVRAILISNETKTG
jgi:hypothetical protein